MNVEVMQVGPQILTDGVSQSMRAGRTGEAVIQQLHGRFYEQAYRNRLFTFGVSNTALVAANAIATGVTSTAQPVLGLWNPPGSGKNLVILQAILGLSTIANSAVSPGGFMWLASVGNQVLSTGSTPFNCGTLVQSGSVAKAFSISTALTGLSGSLSVVRASSIQNINAAGAATAATLTPSPSVEEVDGSLFVPPGYVLALMNQVSTTTINLSTGLTWEEVDV